MRLSWSIGLAALAVFASVWRFDDTAQAQAQNQHAYFNALVTRSDHWRSYSLRDPAQLNHPKMGGMAASNDPNVGLWVTYNPGADTEPFRQDAAKVSIPAFFSGEPLAQAISSSATVLSFASMNTGYVVGRSVKVDNEIMMITERNLTDKTIRVERGKHGTVAAAHAAGALVRMSSNSLQNMVRLPLGTTDGHTYVFTWDAYWTDSYLGSGLTTHKAFQFSSAGDKIWIEPRARYDGGSSCCETPGAFKAATDVAVVDIRAYLNPGGLLPWATDTLLGPGVTNKEPIEPKSATFVIKPNRWTRFWLRVDQRANDYDVMDYWIADEATGPVRIYKNIPISVRANKGTPSIDKFWLEFNTSQYAYRGSQRDLVTYVRNFVALRDSGDPTPLLVRPIPGAVPAANAVPTPPSNVRIVGS